MAREPNREYLFSIRPKCMITLTRYFVWIGNITHIKDNACCMRLFKKNLQFNQKRPSIIIV